MKQPIGETLNVRGSLTLDLNGHTIAERLKRAGAIFTLASGAALTLSGDGRIVDTTSGDAAPYTFVVRGAGAAESSVVIAGGTVVFGGTVTNGWYDGNITFLNCGVTVNGGSLFVRTRTSVISGGSLTVNDGAVVDLGIRHTGGALRMGGLAGDNDTIAFSDACTYAVEDMPGAYRGVTLTISEAAALRDKWIAPAGVACASRGGSAYRRSERAAFGAGTAAMKLMLVDAATFAPLCEAWEQTP